MLAHAGAGADAEIEQVAAHQERRGRGVLDAEGAGAVEEPVHRRAVVIPAAAGAIGGRDARQQLQVDLRGQAAERAVTDRLRRLEPAARREVIGDDAEHFAADVESFHRADVEPIEHLRGRRHARRFVAARSDAAILERGRRRFADVVEQRAEHHRVLLRHGQVVDALTRAVHDHQRVNPHVAFRMPLGILRTVDQRVQLGPEAFDDAEIAREGEADRGARGLA